MQVRSVKVSPLIVTLVEWRRETITIVGIKFDEADGSDPDAVDDAVYTTLPFRHQRYLTISTILFVPNLGTQYVHTTWHFRGYFAVSPMVVMRPGIARCSHGR